MGRQINFYLHPADYVELEDVRKSSGEVVFLPYYHYNNTVRTVEDTISSDKHQNGERIYVVRKADYKNIRLKHIDKFGYWLLDRYIIPTLYKQTNVYCKVA